MSDKKFSRRLHIALALFFFCIAVIAARVLYFGVWAKEHYLKTSEKISVRHITVPAIRGAILDRSGRKLVWTGCRFELWCTLPAGKTFSSKHKAGLEKNFPDRKFTDLSDWSIPLCLELKADEISKLESLIRNGYPLRVRAIRQRQKLRRKIVEKMAGELKNGAGVSGWELEYDAVLRGKNGKCRVVVDSRQNWIPGSFELIEHPQHGKNVIVDILAAEERVRENGAI